MESLDNRLLFQGTGFGAILELSSTVDFRWFKIQNCRYDVKFVGFLVSKEHFRLKKGILAETKRAHQLKGRCIFIDLDMEFPEQVA